jgi:hypothetical protein
MKENPRQAGTPGATSWYHDPSENIILIHDQSLSIIFSGAKFSRQ